MNKTVSILFVFLLIISSCKLIDDSLVNPSDSTTTTKITITQPNGGESLAEGDGYQIKWSTEGTASLVRIQLSIDNGSTWTLIVDSLKNTGIYNWFPVPNTISNQCLIRVAGVDGLSFGKSEKVFAIVRNFNMSLTVVSPKGGETWEAGSQQQIKWYSSGIDSVRIEYTVDNGNHWSFIAVDKNNRGVYYWSPIPSIPSTLAKVRISDAKTGRISAESTSTFTITPEPAIKVIAPNGNEVWYTGTSQEIKWTSSKIENVKLEYTTNNGATWAVIVASTPSNGLYVWNPIPNVSSLQCRVRVSNTTNNNIPSVYSEANFAITTPGTKLIRVINPNGGEKWTAGSKQNITWNAVGITDVKIEYTINSGINWNTIVASTPNTGAYSWEQVVNVQSSNCKVRISDAATGTPIDESDNSFSITPSPTITILSPNGGEVLHSGTIKTIQYTSQYIPNVKIEYTINGGASWITIINSTPSIGTYNWTVPDLNSTQCKVKVSDALFSDPSAISANNFVITNVIDKTIKVLAPNGGELWEAGTKQNIRWSSSAINKVKIEFTTNQGTNWTVLTDSIAGNTFEWNIDRTLKSIQCLVRCSDITDSKISDVSDANFSITTPGSKIINVTSPNGGEKWAAGSNQSITWNAIGVSDVKIEYTINSGISWNTIVASTPSTGFFSWNQVPNIPSTNCKIRISDAATGIPIDESDNLFSITPAPSIVVTSPNGGETLLSGTVKAITYTSQYVPNVKIEFTTDGGAIWSTIISSTPALGTYDWTVPNLNSSQCRIRVTDALFGDPSDISDNNFIVTNVIIKTIKVVSPNGGEDYEAGTKQNITWSSQAINKVKIELTTDKGSNWATLADSVGGGAYEWNIDQSLNSTQCQIRCSDSRDNRISDVSDAVFTISPRKYIYVTKPVGPHVYMDSDPITIEWESSGIRTVGIKYTWTNGVAHLPDIPAYTILVDKIANQGHFTTSFSIPADNQYHIIVYNADEGSNGQPSARSIGNFSIVKTPVGSIVITQPNGGEQWLGNAPNVVISDINYHPYEIKWNGQNINKVKIEWSTNGGGKWYVVPGADSTENDGSFYWAPGRSDSPRPDSSDNCKIKISSTDKNVIAADTSNGYFSIHSSKKIRIEYPNSGEDFYKKDTTRIADQHWPMLIRWTSYAVARVNIYYSIDNGVTYNILASNYSSTGAFGWDFIWGAIPELRPSSLGRIKILDAADSRVWDENDIPFLLNIIVGGNIRSPNLNYKAK